MTKLLTKQFLNNFKDFPTAMNQLGKFVYYRTYSRFISSLKRREVWKETVQRSTEYNISLEQRHFEKLGLPVNTESLRKEAELLYDNMFNIRQFLSGRTLWVGGSENGVSDKYPLANFNCSFINVRSWTDLGDLFYLLLVGTGVGFKCTKKFADELPPIRCNTNLIHVPYYQLPKHLRLENSDLEFISNETVRITVGDSKEGWVEALKLYLKLLTDDSYQSIHTIEINYDSVRPKGERLNTFGGTASGHEPLKDMFEGIDKVLKNQIDPTLAPLKKDQRLIKTPVGTSYIPTYSFVRPIHILDIGNLIGANVVIGGVRRTAQIFLMDADDFETMFAKYGINGLWSEEHFNRHGTIKQKMIEIGIDVPTWFDELGVKYLTYNVKDTETDEFNYETAIEVRESDIKKRNELEEQGYVITLGIHNYGRPLHHRRMSNNSIAFTSKPTRQILNFIFEMMQMEGEPGFINLEQAARRRLHGMGIFKPTQELLDYTMSLIGLNPCAEILLESYGVCNLTTVNLLQFVKPVGSSDISGNIRYELDLENLLEAQRLSVRAGLRMTLAELELPHWNKVQQRDRLLGASLTGVKDAMSMLGYTKKEEKNLLKMLGDTARKEAERYAKYLRVNVPLLVTTVKPEGTLSQVAGGVSSGLHWSHSPFFIRRIRINASDPLAKAVTSLGWVVNPEVGTPGATYEEQMANARTLVIDFPVKSGSNETKDDVSAARQLETYFQFQDEYSDHNSSNTITVRPHEWSEVEEIIYNNWDNFTAVSFLALDGGTYHLMPYESISEEQYNKLLTRMTNLTSDFLMQFEGSIEDLDSSLDGAESCEGGICPIR
ncbi:ribonucleoside-triphosphate reductase, adenosylcobalamin-dependent [Brevibacillus laterosporus]|uniref:ribonucleoside-triphosphate reductase, adenosylcobalamin-dependent n=1 Tax=Brevibacillus laterosporus TaxID=1465 RepID=UPI003D194F81